MNADSLIYRPATIDEIHPLRLAVLRPGHDALRFPGDQDAPPSAWHFGAFTPAVKNVACLTLLSSPWADQAALQLRGMAVAPECRGAGVGTRLLRAAQAAVACHAVALSWPWWCNARVEAVDFYARNGWEVVSDEFMIEGVGPHKKMLRLAGTQLIVGEGVQ